MLSIMNKSLKVNIQLSDQIAEMHLQSTITQFRSMQKDFYFAKIEASYV